MISSTNPTIKNITNVKGLKKIICSMKDLLEFCNYSALKSKDELFLSYLLNITMD